METLSKKEFRKKHNCKSCLYYSKTRKCIAEQICPLEIDATVAKKIRTCPLDESGICPYRNQAGTCFGFCLKQLLMEQEEREEQDEQKKEEIEDGKY